MIEETNLTNQPNTLKLYTFNVQSLVSNVRRSYVINHLTKKYNQNNETIICLQEAEFHNNTMNTNNNQKIIENVNQQLEEREWDCYATSSSHRVKSIFNNIPQESINKYNQLQQLYQTRRIEDFVVTSQSLNNTRLWIFNLYLPNTKEDRVQFLQKIHNSTQYILEIKTTHKVDHIIMVGDFNMVMSASDTENPSKFKRQDEDIQILSQILNTLGLDEIDHQKKMTNNTSNVLTSRRLDRFYVSESLKELDLNIRYQSRVARSTHIGVELTIRPKQLTAINMETHRKKYNQRFVANQQVYMHKQLSKYLIPDYKEFKNQLKGIDMKNILNDYSIMLNKTMVQLQEGWIRFINKTNIQHSEDFKHSELGRKMHTSGAGNQYQHYPTLNRLFQKKMKQQHIESLKDGPHDGNNDTENCSIAKQFYEKLFAKTSRMGTEIGHEIDEFLEQAQIPKLTNEERDNLAKQITLEELETSLKKLKLKHTTAGEDGISYQLLHQHWDSLKEYIHDLAEFIMHTGDLTKGCEAVIITLIPKVKIKGSLDMGDTRAICLQNCILKLISHVVNTRIMNYIDKLIDKPQTGFMPSRKMEDLIITYHQVFQAYTKNKKLYHRNPHQYPSIMSIDIAKAFDTLDHEYLIKVLRTQRFPKRFIQFTQAITMKLIGKIKVNSSYSENFVFKRGVRQGNPLSPTIFIIALEPFLRTLKQRLIGQTVPSKWGIDQRIKYTAYADDCNIFLTGQQDLKETWEITAKFGNISGLKLNKNKTKILFLQEKFLRNVNYVSSSIQNYEREYPNLDGVYADTETSNWKVLGIPLHGVDYNDLQKKWTKRIRYPIVGHQPIATRTLGINTYIMSHMYFYDPFNPMHDKLISHMNEEMNRHFHGTSMKTLHTPKTKGGYSLMNLSTQLQGHRAKLIYNTMVNDYYYGYQSIRDRLQFLGVILAEVFQIGWNHNNLDTEGQNRIRILITNPEFQGRFAKTDDLEKFKYGSFEQSNIGWKGVMWYNLIDGTFTEWYNNLSGTSLLKSAVGEQTRQNKVDTYTLLTKVLPKLKNNEANTLSTPAIRKLVNPKIYLSETELQWIKAFTEVTERTTKINQLSIFTALKEDEIKEKIVESVYYSLKATEKDLKDVEGKPLSEESFRHYNKKRNKIHTKPISHEFKIMNNGREEIVKKTQDPQNWANFWYKLYKLQTQEPGRLEYLQRFNLQNFNHKFHRANEASEVRLADTPNYMNRSCVICGEEEETLQHIMGQCTMSKKIWKEYSPKSRGIEYEDLIMPMLKKDHTRYKELNDYIELIWTIRQQRRYGATKINSYDIEKYKFAVHTLKQTRKNEFSYYYN